MINQIAEIYFLNTPLLAARAPRRYVGPTPNYHIVELGVR
jgi:hypothetical protein